MSSQENKMATSADDHKPETRIEHIMPDGTKITAIGCAIYGPAKKEHENQPEQNQSNDANK